MSTATQIPASESAQMPAYRRKWRNYLLDAGLQIRYTAFIIVVAVFLTAALGYKIYQATQDTSKVIWMTGLVDPVIAADLQAQFRSQDRIILLGIAGFGLILVLSISAVGIWITHKIAGPLYNISRVCARIRDNRMGDPIRALRKGDELQEFHAVVREMYEALRKRDMNTVRVLAEAATAMESLPQKVPALQGSLEALRDLQREKEQSLQAD